MYFSTKRFSLFLFLLLLPFSLLNCVLGETEDERKDRIEREKEKEKQEAIRQARLKFLKEQRLWVDSLMLTLSPRQRIGQLFMVAAYSNKGPEHVAEIENLISEFGIGGLIFFQGGPVRQALLNNRYQQLSKVPLMIGMDAEWGLGMRLDSTISFPKQMTLGAIQDNRNIYDMGVEIARHCRRLGVHVNFAPVVDVNNNPKNPVIGYRSFGEDKYNVAEKGIAYMKGLQDQKVLANAKHFPGHGDTDQDSHLTLPVISHNRQRLSDIELYPFRQLIADSLMSIMVAHLHIPAYDSALNRPTTLSKHVVTDLLIDSLHFEGLIFTDAMNMQGVSKNFKPGEMDVLALQAGNDVLLYPANVAKAVAAIEQALLDSTLTQEFIDKKVRKILAHKYFVGLNKFKPVQIQNLYADLNSAASNSVKERLFEKAITVVRNDNNMLPIIKIDSVSFAAVAIGAGADNRLPQFLKKYAPFEEYHLAPSWVKKPALTKILEAVKNKDVVVVSVQGLNNQHKKNFGVSDLTIEFIRDLQKHTKVIVAVFGNAYSLKNFGQANHLICAYEDDEFAQKAVAQVIFGAIPATGKLPVSVTEAFPVGTGVELTSLGRLGFAIPESVGMSSAVLRKIDEIAQNALLQDATPGCQVLVAKDGKIVYQQNYGYHSYSKQVPVQNESLYDIASITKVVASLPTIMRLQAEGRLDVTQKVRDYLPETTLTNKGDLSLIDILVHQAGLRSFIKYWDSVMVDETRYDRNYVRNFSSEGFDVEISPGLYAKSGIADSLWQWTLDSELTERKNRYGKPRYWYSDVGYYIFQRITEKQLDEPMEDFLDREFYRPLGLQTMTYLPLNKFPKERIAPTEMDIYHRKSLVHGTVHDPGAALRGGIAGHAGIFSNTYDLAIMMQMYLQGGQYGGKRYLSQETVNFFNSRPNERYLNRRGIGWDKPATDGRGGYTSEYCSSETFGHTGFTGTCVWVDPVYNLIYVFLSNRVHPYVGNKELLRTDIRVKIQDVIYQAMGIGKFNMNLYK